MKIFEVIIVNLIVVFVSSLSVVYGQSEDVVSFSSYSDETHEYWFDKNIVEKNGKRIQYKIESIVLEGNNIYMSFSSEYMSKVGEFKPNQRKVLLDFENFWDTTYTNKDFYLTNHSDSLILDVFKNNEKLNSAVFQKPNLILKGKNQREIYFSYGFSGVYFDRSNVGHKIEVLLDGTIKGFQLATRWELGHLHGITSPKFWTRRGVVYFYGRERNAYYVIYDDEKRTVSFYEYTKNKRSIYKLSDEPKFIWFY